MRALSIGVVCFPSFGGSGVVASELGEGLAARGHEVHLLATEPPPRPVKFDEGLVFHRVDVPSYPLFTEGPYTLALASKIVDVCKSHRLDLLHVHYAVPHATSAYLAKQALGEGAPKVVVSLHGTDVTKVGADPSFRPIVSFSAGAADGITTPSRFLKEEAVENLSLDGGAIEVIPNFVDTKNFVPADPPLKEVLGSFFPAKEGDGPTLIHVSNFRAVKRVEDLLEVLSRLVKRFPSARMILVGDGPDREKAEARARSLGLEDSVRFLGLRADFASLLRHADLFLLTSETESFCLAALEALSSGVPVCAYGVGGIPEVVDETVGALATPYDVDQLAAKAGAILEDIRMRESMRRAARARAERLFEREQIIDRYESFLSKVAGGETR